MADNKTQAQTGEKAAGTGQTEPGEVSGTRTNSQAEPMRREQVLPGGLKAEDTGPSQRDRDTASGVGNRETYMDDEEALSQNPDSTDARNRR